MMGRAIGGGPIMSAGQLVLEILNSHPVAAVGVATATVATAVDRGAKAVGSVAENVEKVLGVIKTWGELRKGKIPDPQTELTFRGAAALDPDHRRDLLDAAMQAGAPIKFEP